ncbi:MAG: TSUP family transporter, partial [Cetobacterium sp.]
MLVNIIYGIIVLIATTIGSIAGIGGGVIIKPAFDTLGIHNPTTISFYSSIAVFTMALISILKLLKTGVVLKKEIILPISFGSIIGGILGE